MLLLSLFMFWRCAVIKVGQITCIITYTGRLQVLGLIYLEVLFSQTRRCVVRISSSLFGYYYCTSHAEWNIYRQWHFGQIGVIWISNMLDGRLNCQICCTPAQPAVCYNGGIMYAGCAYVDIVNNDLLNYLIAECIHCSLYLLTVRHENRRLDIILLKWSVFYSTLLNFQEILWT